MVRNHNTRIGICHSFLLRYMYVLRHESDNVIQNLPYSSGTLVANPYIWVINSTFHNTEMVILEPNIYEYKEKYAVS